MKPIPLVFLGCVLPLASSASASWQVSVAQLGLDRYAATVSNLPADVPVPVVQAQLEPVARQVCGDRGFQLGRYRFQTSKPLEAKDDSAGTQRFEQQFDCGAGAPAPRGVAAPRTAPTPKDESTIREMTLAYLSAMDRGDLATANAMVHESAAGMLSGPASHQQRDELIQASGQPVSRDVVRLTWYDDPANAPMKGRYVAADYRADFKDKAFYCGYAVWYLQADGDYRLVRREEGVLSADMANTLSAEQLPGTRAQLGCRD